MPAVEIGIAIGLLALGWLWIDSLSAREIAIRAAKNACTSDDLMLLDETVAIRSLRLARDAEGHVRLQRAYDFEYSDNGDNRLKGGVVLVGKNVTLLNIGMRTGAALHTLH